MAYEILRDITSRFNARNGAVVGVIGGVVCSGIALATNSELRQMPLESIVQGVAIASGTTALATSVVGYLNQKVFQPCLNYTFKRLGVYRVDEQGRRISE